MTLKYPPGTRLKIISDEAAGQIGRYNNEVRSGSIVTIRLSRKYVDSYEIEEISKDVGWVTPFIENPLKFQLGLPNWKQRLSK